MNRRRFLKATAGIAGTSILAAKMPNAKPAAPFAPMPECQAITPSNFCKVLTKDGKFAGVRLASVDPSDKPMDFMVEVKPHALWFTHGVSQNKWYGRSELIGAYLPWRNLTCKGGALDMLRGCPSTSLSRDKHPEVMSYVNFLTAKIIEALGIPTKPTDEAKEAYSGKAFTIVIPQLTREPAYLLPIGFEYGHTTDGDAFTKSILEWKDMA